MNINRNIVDVDKLPTVDHELIGDFAKLLDISDMSLLAPGIAASRTPVCRHPARPGSKGPS